MHAVRRIQLGRSQETSRIVGDADQIFRVCSARQRDAVGHRVVARRHAGVRGVDASDDGGEGVLIGVEGDAHPVDLEAAGRHAGELGRLRKNLLVVVDVAGDRVC